MLPKLAQFFGKNNLLFISRLGKGHSSQIFLVQGKNGKKFAAKIERQDSTRLRMAERESENLSLANSIGIGPKLLAADLEKRIILMEFIGGRAFSEWLFSNPCKKALKGFIKELLAQAKALDKLGLDHGQLAGKGKNILVKEKKPGKGGIGKSAAKPVIIDFEKASLNRKCHNFNTIQAFLFKNPNGAIAKKIREILGEKQANLLCGSH